MDKFKIESDKELAEIITLEYWERWLKSSNAEQEKQEIAANKKLFARQYGTSDACMGANLFAAFAAGMAAGMELEEKLMDTDQEAREKKKEAGGHGADESAAL